MTTSRPGRRRSANTPQTRPADVGRVAAIRDELDARSDGQRQREDTLIADYLSALHQNADIIARRDAAIGDLEQQIRTLTNEAEEELADTEQHRATALAELNKHRSAEKLAVWFGLTPKRVRNLIHAHRALYGPPKPAVAASGNSGKTAPPDTAITTPARPVPTAVGNSTEPLEPVTAPMSSTTATPAPAGVPATSSVEEQRDDIPKAVPHPAGDETERLF